VVGEKVADWMDRAIQNVGNETELAGIKKEVEELCANFPVPGIKL